MSSAGLRSRIPDHAHLLHPVRIRCRLHALDKKPGQVLRNREFELSEHDPKYLRRPHLRRHMVRLRLRGVRDRRVLANDRGLARVELASNGPGSRRPRAGDPLPSRYRRTDSPQRSRRTVPVDPVHGAPRRGWHRAVRWQHRRLVRQRSGRVRHRPVQDGDHPAARSLALDRRRRVRDAGMGRLVQHAADPRADREHPSRRV